MKQEFNLSEIFKKNQASPKVIKDVKEFIRRQIEKIDIRIRNNHEKGKYSVEGYNTLVGIRSDLINDAGKDLV